MTIASTGPIPTQRTGFRDRGRRRGSDGEVGDRGVGRRVIGVWGGRWGVGLLACITIYIHSQYIRVFCFGGEGGGSSSVPRRPLVIYPEGRTGRSVSRRSSWGHVSKTSVRRGGSNEIRWADQPPSSELGAPNTRDMIQPKLSTLWSDPQYSRHHAVRAPSAAARTRHRRQVLSKLPPSSPTKKGKILQKG